MCACNKIAAFVLLVFLVHRIICTSDSRDECNSYSKLEETVNGEAEVWVSDALNVILTNEVENWKEVVLQILRNMCVRLSILEEELRENCTSESVEIVSDNEICVCNDISGFIEQTLQITHSLRLDDQCHNVTMNICKYCFEKHILPEDTGDTFSERTSKLPRVLGQRMNCMSTEYIRRSHSSICNMMVTDWTTNVLVLEFLKRIHPGVIYDTGGFNSQYMNGRDYCHTTLP